ncbi:hypothetical protein [Sinorhizobium prairiense]|uniref:hypothetical protein n=1 Tax=unclassified Sinorhizobium TaxID=2613772 RepID=UPI0023D865F0|nr:MULTISPECIES: hypothetical protein [unclassified Sinorhizobium]WEJ11759.1 TIGR02391 family protein [Sinorhizobium sp. M103]WEJ17620.1 TIGR02391 family protein [Sinorhizobium sp. K101]WEJ40426.1 TIGR02391 family protein [Sinorhizobium sp. C101]
MKSVIEKLRKRTGLIDDGNVLFDRVFGGETPILTINATGAAKPQPRGRAKPP